MQQLKHVLWAQPTNSRALFQPKRLRVFSGVDDVLPFASGRPSLLGPCVADNARTHATAGLGWVVRSFPENITSITFETYLVKKRKPSLAYVNLVLIPLSISSGSKAFLSNSLLLSMYSARRAPMARL